MSAPRKARKAHVVATVRINAYEILDRAVEEGVHRGWARAHEHNDEPDDSAVCAEIEQAVMAALSEVLRWD